MSTGSLPFGFDEYHRDLNLPEGLREHLRIPLGEVHRDEAVVTALRGLDPVAAVGDYCARDLIDRQVNLKFIVVDYRIERRDDPDLRAPLARFGDRSVVVENPAATIRRDAWDVIHEAFISEQRLRVEVRGEEDLLALPCIALAPDGAAVVYGLPGRGAVVVRVNSGAREAVRAVLARMV